MGVLITLRLTTIDLVLLSFLSPQEPVSLGGQHPHRSQHYVTLQYSLIFHLHMTRISVREAYHDISIKLLFPFTYFYVMLDRGRDSSLFIVFFSSFLVHFPYFKGQKQKKRNKPNPPNVFSYVAKFP